MTRYRVTIESTAVVQVDVEASNEEEAKTKASKEYDTTDVGVEIETREDVTDVKKLEDDEE